MHEDIIQLNDRDFQEQLQKIRELENLSDLVLKYSEISKLLAKKLLEKELERRAQKRIDWPRCPECKAKIENKETQKREIISIIGRICWKRKVGRCPNGCKIGQIVPSDDSLGLEKQQRASRELQKIACALAVFVPYETTSTLISLLLEVCISHMTIWNWVQKFGQQQMDQLEDEILSGRTPEKEPMDDETMKMPLVIGADGVNAPFRPNGGSPKGKTVWSQVKVGIVSRLKTSNSGKTKIVKKRFIAVIGEPDDLGVRLWLEALRQNIVNTRPVVWLSDGGRGFWNVYHSYFSYYAKGVLDFYHAAQNIWKAAKIWLDGRTKHAKLWFESLRHTLRHGKSHEVLTAIKQPLQDNSLSDNARKALENLHAYFTTHYLHINYASIKSQGLPIGSGMIESGCKYLVQQRFKGVGMRWSVDGFNSLMHLRLAWVNGRFDFVFSP